MNTPQQAISLDEALYSFAMEERKLTPELLDEYVKQFPNYAAALTDLAVGLLSEEIGPEAPAHPEAASQKNPLEVPAVARAMSRFQYQFKAVRLKASLAKPQQPVANPFSSLSKEQVSVSTKELGINIPFFIKLRDRLIEVATIPDLFIDLVSKSLNVDTGILRAHFSEPPRLAAASYKATDKPAAVSQQSYREAVMNSEMSADQQQALLALGS